MNPPEVALSQPMVTVLLLRIQAVSALISQSLRKSHDSDVGPLLEKLFAFSEPLKEKGWPQGFLYRAYGSFLREQPEIALQDAIECARLASRERRVEMLNDLQFPENYSEDFKANPVPKQQEFCEWFLRVTGDVDPLESRLVRGICG